MLRILCFSLCMKGKNTASLRVYNAPVGERPKPPSLQDGIYNVSSNLTWGTNYRHGLEWFLARRDMALLEGSIPYLPTNLCLADH